MSHLADHRIDTVAAAAGPLTRVFGRPKWIAGACVIALTGLGWAYLAIALSGSPGGGATLPWWPRLIDVICQPSFGHAHGGIAAGWSGADLVLVWLMWCAMALAMMLPGAGPMIYTYAEIADTAARKREPIVSPLVIALGYVAVWIGFATAATAAQGLLLHFAAVDPGLAAAGPLFSGAIFAGAGAYQFSALKHACLKQCQQPFQFFFVHWETTRRGVFRLGLRQGLYCLGCCWAMMLLMFAVGTMNIVWMIALGIIMTAEKMTTTLRLTKIIGVVLIAIGVALIAQSMISHWPGSAA